jgi:hypothetical protein
VKMNFFILNSIETSACRLRHSYNLWPGLGSLSAERCR